MFANPKYSSNLTVFLRSAAKECSFWGFILALAYDVFLCKETLEHICVYMSLDINFYCRVPTIFKENEEFLENSTLFSSQKKDEVSLQSFHNPEGP